MTQMISTRAPGRPRSEATRQAILEASYRLLEDESFGRISIERIASDAKVGKQSIYRWWDGKADVLLEAFTERALKQLPVHTSKGNVFEDLEALLTLFFSNVSDNRIGKTLRGLIAEAQLDPEFRAKFYSVFVSTRRGMIRSVLLRGAQLGQLKADLDIELMIDLVYGGFWYRLLSGTPSRLDAGFAKELVAMLRPSMEGTKSGKS